MESKSPARGRSRTPKPATGRRASSKGKHVTTKAHASPAPSASPSPAPRRRSAVRRAATPHVKLEDAVPASPTSPTPQKPLRFSEEGGAEPPAPADEFGGPWGCLAIIAFSHFIVLYLYHCNWNNNGEVLIPKTTGEALGLFKEMFLAAAGHGDLWLASKVYLAFFGLQAVLFMVMPGIQVLGRPLPNRNNLRLVYNCNGVSSFALTNAIAFTLHYTGVFPMHKIIENLGALIVVGMIVGDVVSFLVYAGAYLVKEEERMSGNVVYDYFMGAWLNPRFASLDLKMLLETRVAWIMLFYVTVGAAATQYQESQTIAPSMWFMLTAHFLYANACMKGEECVCTTWDIFHEKLGWMLIYWNMCGVPLAYSFQSVFILKHPELRESLSDNYVKALFVVLFIAYYIWDTANSQKNRFRMMEEGSYMPRPWALPQLPWGTLHNPRYVQTKHGNKLLTDGWYRFGRKMHYTADITMALLWGLSCGTTHFLPFYYVCFFATFLVFRSHRDFARCKAKYGADWDEYVRQVPYSFIPGIY